MLVPNHIGKGHIRKAIGRLVTLVELSTRMRTKSPPVVMMQKDEPASTDRNDCFRSRRDTKYCSFDSKAGHEKITVFPEKTRENGCTQI